MNTVKFVTNSTYTRQARVLAESNDCVLVDKDTLAEWIVEFQAGGELSEPNLNQ